MSETVYECHGDGEVEVVLSFLAANGIRAVTASLSSRSVHPFTVDGMGKISILVEEADAEQARRLMSAHEFRADDASEERT